MSLGVKERRTYLNIKEGRIIARDQEGREQSYDYVEGSLIDIRTKDREFNGEAVKYWYFDILDLSGNLYSLSLHYTSGVAKSLLNSLASAEDLTRIRIEPYYRDGFTKIVVYSGGNKLPWKYPELPPVNTVMIGNREVKDDSKRQEFFEEIARDLRKRTQNITG